MSAVASDGYARARLLELLGIEPLVRIAARPGATPQHGAARAGPADARFALLVAPDDRERHAALLKSVAAALGPGATAFEPAPGRHAICFGTTPPDAGADATLAPPLAALRLSPAAKRALWQSLRRLRAARTEH